MIRTRIIGTGSYVPPDILTNDNLSEMVDTSDEWIRTRTGICNRHIAKDMDNADMAYNAARNAVEDARIEASKIGLIIVATSTPDYAFPNQASLVQAKLKAVNAMCFDVSAACSGFITALDIAASMLKAGSYKYALVIGSEKMSEIVNWKDRSVCVLFGDGAGAVLIKAADNMYRQINYTRGDTDVLVCRGIGAQDAYVKMNGNAVFRFAVDVLKQGIDEILKKSDMTLDDIDYIVCHQANERIINHVKKKYPGHEYKFYINIAEYGNTSAASIPIALDELAQRGCFDKGRKLILAGFGAGLSWSSALIET